jgi:hypothetical protein
MIYNFDTEEKSRAIAALLVYAIYRSRDTERFTVSTKMWDQITNFSKLAAKKSSNLAEFIELFKKPMRCDALKPKYCVTGNSKHLMILKEGELFESGTERREFITSLLEQANETKVLSLIINETSFIIMLVRERLESEKIAKQMEGK